VAIINKQIKKRAGKNLKPSPIHHSSFQFTTEFSHSNHRIPVAILLNRKNSIIPSDGRQHLISPKSATLSAKAKTTYLSYFTTTRLTYLQSPLEYLNCIVAFGQNAATGTTTVVEGSGSRSDCEQSLDFTNFTKLM
jgi:hypothetical protein